MGEAQVDKIVVRFVGDSTSYDAAVDRVTKRMEGMAAKAMHVGKRMSLAFTAPLLGLKGASVAAFSAFDGAMTQSTSIMSGITAELRKEMELTAITLSKKTGGAARDLAESYFFLASAGLDARQSMAALPAVAAFGKAGMFDLAKATDLLTDAQSALGLTMKDPAKNLENMTRLSDVLVKANTLANASVEQFSTSLTTKSAAALRNHNKSVEEGVAVLAAFADQGIKSHRSGEMLTDMIMGMEQAATNPATKKYFKEFGVDIFDTEGKMRNLADIIADFEGAMAGASDEQKTMMFSQMGLRETTAQAIVSLSGASDKIRDYETALKDAAGTTADVAAKQMQSFPAQLAITRAHVVAMSIDIGRVLAPGVLRLNKVIEAGTNIWDKWSDSVKLAAVTLAGLVAATGPALVAFGFLGPYAIKGAKGIIWLTKALKGYIVVARTAAMATLAPFAPWIAGAALAGLAIAGLIRLIGGPGSLTAIWGGVKGAAADAFKNIKGFVHNFGENVDIILGWVKENFFNAGEIISTYFATSMHNAVVALKIFWRAGVAVGAWLLTQFPLIIEDVFMRQIPMLVGQAVLKILGYWMSFVELNKEVLIGLAMFVATTFNTIARKAMETMLIIATVFQKGMEMIKKRDFIGLALAMGKVGHDLKTQMDETFVDIGVAATTSLGGVLRKFEEMRKQFTEDAIAGASNPNIFATIADIFNQEAGGFKNPLGGFSALGLNLELPKELTEPVKPEVDLDTDEADKKNKELRDRLGQPLMIPIGVQGTLAGSVDAVAKAMQQGLKGHITQRRRVTNIAEGEAAGAGREGGLPPVPRNTPFVPSPRDAALLATDSKDVTAILGRIADNTDPKKAPKPLNVSGNGKQLVAANLSGASK